MSARNFFEPLGFFQCARQPLYRVDPVYSKHVNMQAHYADLNPPNAINVFFVMRGTVTLEMLALKRMVHAVDLR